MIFIKNIQVEIIEIIPFHSQMICQNEKVIFFLAKVLI